MRNVHREKKASRRAMIGVCSYEVLAPNSLSTMASSTLQKSRATPEFFVQIHPQRVVEQRPQD